MVKRTQSKSLRLKNDDYRNFVQAWRNYDEVNLKKGYEKGYRIGNKVFINRLINELNIILSGENAILNIIDPQNAIKYINEDYINDKISNGNNLLDTIVDIFTQAINYTQDNLDPSLQYYLIMLYEVYLRGLILKGAEISKKPVYPKKIDLRFAQIKRILKSFELDSDSEEEIEEDNDSDDSREY